MIIGSTGRRHRATRPTKAIGFAIAACIALAACGGDDGDGAEATTAPTTVADASPSTTAGGSPAAASGDVPADAYPVTIEHAFGSTTIESEPQRVVTLGFTDHEPVLALGVEPVAIRQWYGDYEYVWPWAEDALGDATPEVVPSGDLNFEQVAALQPDLIIALYIGLDAPQYEQLAAIAPTVAQSGDYPSFGMPWQAITRTAGLALGRSSAAEALIADVEGQFAAARAAHPEFEGVDVAYAGAFGEKKYYIENEGSTRVKVLLDLGFVIPAELAALGSDSFYHEISNEQLSLVDQDIVVWEPADPTLMPQVLDDPLYKSLAVAVEGRQVLLTDPIVGAALAHSTALSLPLVLESIVPELAKAVANMPG